MILNEVNSTNGTRLFKNLEVTIIKRTSMFFTLFFVLITVLIISSLILIMVFDYQDMDNYMDNYIETESQQAGKPSSEYWTKERMQEAEPQTFPTVNKKDKLKEFISDTLPIQIILFIILTVFLTLINMRKIKLLEKQIENILNESPNIDGT